MRPRAFSLRTSALNASRSRPRCVGEVAGADRRAVRRSAAARPPSTVRDGWPRRGGPAAARSSPASSSVISLRSRSSMAGIGAGEVEARPGTARRRVGRARRAARRATRRRPGRRRSAVIVVAIDDHAPRRWPARRPPSSASPRRARSDASTGGTPGSRRRLSMPARVRSVEQHVSRSGGTRCTSGRGRR